MDKLAVKKNMVSQLPHPLGVRLEPNLLGLIRAGD